MEVQELHAAGWIDHVQLVVRDLETSRRFYGNNVDGVSTATRSGPRLA
ncbi:hypothetical protein [Sphingomonas lutea]|nr:hypothetical protein [Sphingomonas lutea]